ncbi:MAG TPA: hypothetical protein VGP93_15320 [Polyangiaceae bacterium]|nr:hypothetical protein [Polyangiaceae bacterium]
MHGFVAGAAALLASTVALPSFGAAAIPTCVEVVTGSGSAEPLRRLVESELDRHPSHRAAEHDCMSYLRVELIELDSVEGGGRFLTARINEQVPERVQVGVRGIAPALEQLLTIVLHNDPVVLHGPASHTWLGDQSQAFVRGRNYYGLETFELFTRVGERLQTLPGMAFTARRETRSWYLGLRLNSALSPDPSQQQSELIFWLRAEVEAGVFESPAAATSFFGALLLGAEYQRFSGPAPLLGPDARGTAVSAGFAPGLRGGLELLRVGQTRVTIFAQASLPAFLSTDPDAGVVHQWLPAAAIGAGAVL